VKIEQIERPVKDEPAFDPKEEGGRNRKIAGREHVKKVH